MQAIIKLSANIDDMTAEELGFAMDRLIEAGARDVYFVPIVMKKNRPAIELCVLVSREQEESFVEKIFFHTTTLGLRREEIYRYTRQRETKLVRTSYGEVRIKTSEGYGAKKRKIEYEDLARIAGEQGKSLQEMRALIEEYLAREDI